MERNSQHNLLVVTIGDKSEPVVQDNIEYVYLAKDDQTVRKLNNLANQTKYDYCLFMTNYHSVIHDEVIDILLEKATIHPNISCFYGDTVINDLEGNLILYRPHMSYDFRHINNMGVLNIPFMVQWSFFPCFREGIKELFLWDGLKQSMQTAMAFHIPRPLFNIANISVSENLQHDLEIINE